MHKLEVKSLVKTIKKTPIVRGMSLEVNSAEVVGLLGPNGAGKTTTFYMICGLVKATSGEVFFDNENISNMPLHERALKGIGVPDLHLENIAEIKIPLPPKEIQEKIVKAMEREYC